MQHKNEQVILTLEKFIKQWIDENGMSPTVREISDGTGIPKSTVSRYLAYMREHGIIDYAGHRNIVTREMRMTNSQTISVPVLGTVSCGVPKLAAENIEEYVRLPVALFGKGDFFLLRANGDSMIEVGIDDGDLVLIRQQSYAEEGQIAVALVDDEATLKRFYPEPENHRVRLHPENSSMEDIYVDDCIVQGIAVKVMKDLI